MVSVDGAPCIEIGGTVGTFEPHSLWTRLDNSWHERYRGQLTAESREEACLAWEYSLASWPDHAGWK
jgi:hypothetical protein